MSNTEYCVCCGQVIPEGRQHCIICGKKAENGKQRQIDRIRNMSVEELAKFLYPIVEQSVTCSYCPVNDFCDENIVKFGCTVTMLKQWLEQEVEE